MAFAEVIDALLSDPDRRRQMGELGRNRVKQQFSWEISRRALVQFYEDLLGTEGRIRDDVVSTRAESA